MSVPNVGDLWRLVGDFYSDPDETTPADPTAVTLTIRDPAGVVLVATPGIVHDGTGVYHYDWTPLVGGTHEIIWHGTGAVQVVSPETLTVRSGLDTALATTDYIREVLGSTGSSNNDALLARLALVVSEHIMQHCDRRFLPSTGVASARTFRARPGLSTLSLVPWDFQSAEAVAITFNPATSASVLTLDTDFYVEPANHPWGIADRIMLARCTQGYTPTVVQVTATWGWPVIPPQIAEACAYWVRDLIRGVSAYTQNAQVEDATVTLADGTVPAHCRQLLAPFRHMVVA